MTRPIHDLDAIAAVIAVYAGARLGETRPPVAVPAVILFMGALIAWRGARRPLRIVAVVAGAACCLLATSTFLMGRALAGLEHTSDRSGIAKVELVTDPATRGFATSVLGRLGGHRVLLSASGANGSRLSVLSAGDVVEVSGQRRPLHAYERRYRWQHVVARLGVRDVIAVRRSGSWLANASNAVRRRVMVGSDALPAAVGALDVGFLLGDTRAIAPEVSDQFRRAGLSHLLAVSGANVVFVLALVGPFLRRCPIGTRFVLGVLVLVLFGAVTRWQPSVLRAVAMAVVALGAQWAGRPVSSLRVLCLAGGALVLADPFLIHSVGFGLSCGACAGIALWAAPIQARLPGPAWMREAVAVTAAAQIGVAPVLLPVFGTLPLIALPANLLAAPAVGPLTLCGLVGAATAGFTREAAPGLAHLVQLPAVGLIRYVAVVAAAAARVPLALRPRDCAAILAVAAAIAAAVVGSRRVRYARRS